MDHHRSIGLWSTNRKLLAACVSSLAALSCIYNGSWFPLRMVHDLDSPISVTGKTALGGFSRSMNAVRVGKCDDGAKWICLDLFIGRTTRRAIRLSQQDGRERKCVVYSFGSSDDSCFETAMAERSDCEIHIFDPTSSTLKDDRWTYHSYGLGGVDSNDTNYWSWKTQLRADCKGCPMKSLDEIMQELGHTAIDVLKVDIDGAEWRSFSHAYKALKGLPADQIQVELTGVDVTDLEDSLAGGLPGVYHWWKNILADGYKVFYLESNKGTCVYRDQTRGASIEYALWRPPS